MRQFIFLFVFTWVAACGQESVGSFAATEPAKWTPPNIDLSGYPPQINEKHVLDCRGELDSVYGENARAECDKRLKDPIGWELDHLS